MRCLIAVFKASDSASQSSTAQDSTSNFHFSALMNSSFVTAQGDSIGL